MQLFCHILLKSNRQNEASWQKKKGDKSKIAPVHKLVTDEQGHKVLAADDNAILDDRINDLAKLIWHHENMEQSQIELRVVRAIEHLNSFKPADGAEAMLAQQMVGSHFAAMECLRRAALPN